MSSIHLTDAKKECQDNQSCQKFYHVCGRGSKFKFCTDASTESPSTCGAVLYKMDKIGNQNVLCHHGHFRDIQYNSFNLILMYHFDSLDATTQIVPMPTTETTPGNNAQRQKNVSVLIVYYSNMLEM